MDGWIDGRHDIRRQEAKDELVSMGGWMNGWMIGGWVDDRWMVNDRRMGGQTDITTSVVRKPRTSW